MQKSRRNRQKLEISDNETPLVAKIFNFKKNKQENV